MNFSGRYLKFAAFLEAPMWLLIVVLVIVTALVVGTTLRELSLS